MIRFRNWNINPAINLGQTGVRPKGLLTLRGAALSAETAELRMLLAA